jgi:hypothetical protein
VAAEEGPCVPAVTDLLTVDRRSEEGPIFLKKGSWMTRMSTSSTILNVTAIQN